MKKRNRYRYVQTFVDIRGRTRNYFRRNGDARIALPENIRSVEFARAYRIALDRYLLPAEKAATARELVERVDQPMVGVYLLLLNGIVVYVGSSLDMPARVVQHRVNWRPFDRVFYIPTKRNERAALERTLIRAINPPQNRANRERGLSERDPLDSLAVD